MTTGFSNNYTQGEICQDAWDRNDIQPINKGCELAENWIIRVAGPLAKRRGFWDLGPVNSEAHAARLIPFRRSKDDALMLVFQDLAVWVYQSSGDPLLSGGVPFTFPSPYALADLATLRFKQVADVIYIRSSTGLQPRALQRNTNTNWQFNLEEFDNGPWRAENTDAGFTVTVAGAVDHDANPDTATTVGSIGVGNVVTLVASSALFDAGHVNGHFRLRASDGSPGPMSWYAGFKAPVGYYTLSNGRVYICTVQSTWAIDDDGDGSHYYSHNRVAAPPVHTQGIASDGGNTWRYLHDGAGIVRIDTVTDATHASGTVLACLPFPGGATSFWAERAYSDYRGWPRAWPNVREERFVEGGTATDTDYVDLSETAGFLPAQESFSPGLGTGQVIDIDAVRRRLGDDGAPVQWFQTATYLVAGTDSAEYLIAGSVLDEPISPAAVVVKQLSAYGSADVFPARVQRGIVFVTAGGESLRLLDIDTQQNMSGDDLSLLAEHIGQRGLRQLAWIPKPDQYLGVRLGDGGLAFFTFHQEQQVKGWTSTALPGGWTVEDVVALPGPGGYETLWLVVSRVKAAVTQRRLWLQSQRTDNLFMDGAQFYSGAPATIIAGLDYYEGEQVLALADGAQVSGLVVTGGEITLPTAASVVHVGLGYTARFKSLDLAQGWQLGQAIGERQRPTDAIVSLMTAEAFVGLDGRPMERVTSRTASDVPAAVSRRVRKNVTLAGDTAREQHIVIEDSTAYDARIYSIRPKVQVGG
ncbi:MAG TPA: hypothetical protein VIJ94_11340 [Caulobacteraceae bacterium]